MRFCEAVAAKLDATAGQPEEFTAFPGEGLVARSMRYLARDMLGHSELKNGFIADYKLGEAEFKVLRGLLVESLNGNKDSS